MPSELDEASLRDILHNIDLVQQLQPGKTMRLSMPILCAFMRVQEASIVTITRMLRAGAFGTPSAGRCCRCAPSCLPS